MKKSLIPMFVFLCTVILCKFLDSPVETFKNYSPDSITVNYSGISGCEISCRNEKGLIKKYNTNRISYKYKFNVYDFNGDGINEVYIYDEKNYEIIDFSPSIPICISDQNDFKPVNLRFTKNENSHTAYLDNGQNFELHPENTDELCLEHNCRISVSDFNADKIYEICLSQDIKNQSGETLYNVKTYRVFNGKYFTISDIKITAV